MAESRSLRRLGALLVCAFALVAMGCAEVSERLAFDTKGGGTYALSVRWNGDLWRRVGGVLGNDVLAKVEGRPFPLTAAAWRACTAGVAGVTVVKIDERDAGKGWRQLEVELRFTSLAALLRVEPFAQRSLRVAPTPKPTSGSSTTRYVDLEMTPLTSLPVLDPLAALANALDTPPPGSTRHASPRDPTPLRRLGVDVGEADMVRRLIGPSLKRAKVSFRVEAPGVLVRVGGRPVQGRETAHTTDFDFEALRKASTDRRIRLRWRMAAHDTPPVAAHQGDRADRTKRFVRK